MDHLNKIKKPDIDIIQVIEEKITDQLYHFIQSLVSINLTDISDLVLDRLQKYHDAIRDTEITFTALLTSDTIVSLKQFRQFIEVKNPMFIKMLSQENQQCFPTWVTDMTSQLAKVLVNPSNEHHYAENKISVKDHIDLRFEAWSTLLELANQSVLPLETSKADIMEDYVKDSPSPIQARLLSVIDGYVGMYSPYRLILSELLRYKPKVRQIFDTIQAVVSSADGKRLYDIASAHLNRLVRWQQAWQWVIHDRCSERLTQPETDMKKLADRVLIGSVPKGATVSDVIDTTTLHLIRRNPVQVISDIHEHGTDNPPAPRYYFPDGRVRTFRLSTSTVECEAAVRMWGRFYHYSRVATDAVDWLYPNRPKIWTVIPSGVPEWDIEFAGRFLISWEGYNNNRWVSLAQVLSGTGLNPMSNGALRDFCLSATTIIRLTKLFEILFIGDMALTDYSQIWISIRGEIRFATGECLSALGDLPGGRSRGPQELARLIKTLWCIHQQDQPVRPLDNDLMVKLTKADSSFDRLLSEPFHTPLETAPYMIGWIHRLRSVIESSNFFDSKLPKFDQDLPLGRIGSWNRQLRHVWLQRNNRREFKIPRSRNKPVFVLDILSKVHDVYLERSSAPSMFADPTCPIIEDPNMMPAKLDDSEEDDSDDEWTLEREDQFLRKFLICRFQREEGIGEGVYEDTFHFFWRTMAEKHSIAQKGKRADMAWFHPGKKCDTCGGVCRASVFGREVGICLALTFLYVNRRRNWTLPFSLPDAILRILVMPTSFLQSCSFTKLSRVFADLLTSTDIANSLPTNERLFHNLTSSFAEFDAVKDVIDDPFLLHPAVRGGAHPIPSYFVPVLSYCERWDYVNEVIAQKYFSPRQTQYYLTMRLSFIRCIEDFFDPSTLTLDVLRHFLSPLKKVTGEDIAYLTSFECYDENELSDDVLAEYGAAFRDWLSELSDIDIKALLRYWTGSTTVDQSTELRVIFVKGPVDVVARTCLHQIELSWMGDAKDLKNWLATALQTAFHDDKTFLFNLA
jgi:hypothetical protein